MIMIGLKEYGTAEIPGNENNPEVLKYFAATDFSSDHLSDETAWCSAYVNWVAREAGLERTGKLNARSWLDIGEEVTDPEPGDVVVFWRVKRDDWRGHVGIFINQTGGMIWTLGGNQGNRVSILAYPEDRLLGYRKLRKL